jgi:choline dehydrogenase-like flavoprotein
MRRFDSYWARHGLNAIGTLDWTYDPTHAADAGVLASDVFHPGGSTRMGISRGKAVVDSDLRCFSVRNLWVASTSAFPSGGGANPTLTLMQFTMRLADHLCKEIASGSAPVSLAA